MARRILTLALVVAVLAPGASAKDEFRDFRDSLRSTLNEDATAEDRLAAVEAVATFGSEDSTRLLIDVIPFLYDQVQKLIEKRELIRSGRDRSLKGRRPEPYLKALKGQIDGEYQALEAIETGLGKLTEPDAIEYLARDALSREKLWKSREMVARVLGKIGDRNHLERLVKALGDKDARVRTSVLLSLASMRAEEALSDIVDALEDKDWMVRWAAIEALGKIRDVRAFEPLLERMQEEEGRLAEDCAEALEKITGQAFGRSVAGWESWWEENRTRALAGERLDLPKEEKKPEEDDGYYHGIPVKSRRTIFIIDVSESMSYSTYEFQEKPKEGELSRLGLAKRELTRAIENYDPKGAFGLIAFHSVVMQWRPRLVPATPQMKDDGREWVGELKPTGTTNIYDSLELAFKMAGMGLTDKHYEPAADTIFLLSDGAPTNEDLTDDDPDRILRAVRNWNRLGRVQIHTIGMKGHSASFMSRLATENGGTYASRD